MTALRIAYGFNVAGVGFDLAETKGAAFFVAGHDPDDMPASLYEWIPALITEPKSIATKYDPFTGRVSVSSFAFALSNSDRMAETFQHVDTDNTDFLQAALDSSATTVPILTGTPGSVVYVGDECIKLGTDIGSTFTGCTRGFWGTHAAPHAAGVTVYRGISQWKYRLVSLVEFDLDAGTDRVIWRGRIDDFDASPWSVNIKCREFFGSLLGLSVNRAGGDLNEGLTAKAAGVDGVQCVSSGYVSKVRAFPSGSTTPSGIAAMAAGALVRVTAYPDPAQPSAYLFTSNNTMLDASGTRYPGVRLGSSMTVPDGPWHDPIDEIFAIDRVGDESDPTRKLSSTQDLALPYHPLAVALALTVSDGEYSVSDFKVLADDFAAACPFIDITEWEAEIDARSDLNEAIDYWLLAVGGGKVRIFEEIRKLLIAWGYSLVITEGAELKPTQFERLSIEHLENAGVVRPFAESSFHWMASLSASVSRLYANVGALPWRAGSRIQIGIAGDSPTAGKYDQGRNDLDMPFINSGRAVEVGDILNSGALMASVAYPRISVIVASSLITGVTYDLGDRVKLGELPIVSKWIVGSDGVRVAAVEDLVDFIGQITSRKMDLSNGTVELELMLTSIRDGAYAKRRGPSMVIVEVLNFGARLVCADVSEFGSPLVDSAQFAAGHEFRVWSRSGVVESPAQTGFVTSVGVIGGGDDRGYIDISGATYSAGNVGDVVRIQESTTFQDLSNTVTERPFAYLSNAGGKVKIFDASHIDGDPMGGGYGL